MNEFLNSDILQTVWQAQGLGVVKSFHPAQRGMNNLATVVNDTYVIRFDRLDLPGPCRYLGEALAYERMHAANIPAPDVIVLDTAKTLVPYHYIILSKLPGRLLIDDWTRFSHEQQAKLGFDAGRYLALLHEIRFDGFGKLSRLDTSPWPHWYDHVEVFFNRYAPGLVKSGVIEATVYNRMQAVIDRLRPTFNFVGGGRLVHSDYQFENVLHQDGDITGIIDFEWSIAGDPTWDFKLDEQWDDDCPGSAAHIYAGYTSVRPLAENHDVGVWLYKLLFHLDSVDMYAAEPEASDNLVQSRDELLQALIALEKDK